MNIINNDAIAIAIAIASFLGGFNLDMNFYVFSPKNVEEVFPLLP